MTTQNGVRVLGLNHVSFTVRDLDGPIALFRDGLGFELTSRGGRPAGVAAALTGVAGAEVEIAFLSAAGFVIELIAYSAPDNSHVELPTPAMAGAAHVAVDVADIAAMIELCARFGTEMLGEIVTIAAGPNRGGRLAYLRHPAGVFIEVIEKPNPD